MLLVFGLIWGVCPVGGVILGIAVGLRRWVHVFIGGLGVVFVYYRFVSGRFSGLLLYWAGWFGLPQGAAVHMMCTWHHSIWTALWSGTVRQKSSCPRCSDWFGRAQRHPITDTHSVIAYHSQHPPLVDW